LRHIYTGVILGAHPVRDESHIEHNVNGEVEGLHVCTIHQWMQAFKKVELVLIYIL